MIVIDGSAADAHQLVGTDGAGAHGAAATGQARGNGDADGEEGEGDAIVLHTSFVSSTHRSRYWSPAIRVLVGLQGDGGAAPARRSTMNTC